MSEKRTVLLSFIFTEGMTLQLCQNGEIQNLYLGKVSDFSNIEIVKITEQESERRLVKPKGAVWIISRIFTRIISLVVDGVEIAAVNRNEVKGFQWSIKAEIWRGASTPELAKQAAEEALATAGKYGFYWEEVEPDYWFYLVLCDQSDKRYLPPENIPLGWEAAQDEFMIQSKVGCWNDVTLVGVTSDFKMEIIKSYAKESEESDG